MMPIIRYDENGNFFCIISVPPQMFNTITYMQYITENNNTLSISEMQYITESYLKILV